MTYTLASHIHSSISYDGSVPLSEIAELLREEGVDVACITEHSDFLSLADVREFISLCREYGDESLLLIPGLEVPSSEGHVLVIGIDQDIEVLDPRSVIEQYRGAAFIVFPHPHRSNFDVGADMLKQLDAIEVWNSHYDGKHYPRKGSRVYLGKLQEKYDICAFAGLDFHRHSHWGGPLIEVEATSLAKSAVIDALKSGSYVIAGGGIEISAKGRVYGRAEWVISFLSLLHTALITFLKGASKVLHNLHIRPPQGLKEWLRRRM